MSENKHKHHAMIAAKAANMDLVLFIKDNGTWVDGYNLEHLVQWKDMEFFACLPQHAKACEHWLNGGDVICANVDVRDGVIHKYNGTWSPNHYFMSSVHVMSIKPKSERELVIGMVSKIVEYGFESDIGTVDIAEKICSELDVKLQKEG